MLRSRATCIAFAALASLGVAAVAAEPGSRPYAVGDAVADFTATDAEGVAFSLAKAREVTAADAHAAVVAAAKAAGATAEPKAEDSVGSLPGVRKGDTVDSQAVLAFVRAAGRPFGLRASEKTAAGLATIGDVEAWIVGAAQAPIVLAFWSPKCPAVKEYRERFEAVVEESGARAFVVASNFNDDAATVKAAAAEQGWRAFVDADARVADLFGAKRTPHVFVLDAKNRLRYAGAIDDDQHMQKPEAARTNWLADALASVSRERPLAVLMTEPVG